MSCAVDIYIEQRSINSPENLTPDKHREQWNSYDAASGKMSLRSELPLNLPIG